MNQTQDSTAKEHQLRRIGQGFCGTVWAPTNMEETLAIKREDGGPGRSLLNDFNMHTVAHHSLLACNAKINVTACCGYIAAEDRVWWTKHISTFPQQFRIPCYALVSERILPFSSAIRDLLIERYCPQSLQTSIRLSEADRDCLIRPYLGRRRRSARKSQFQAFSLRNYPLHLDQMEELALDTTLYARRMAETLAILYWKAQMDANDIEFVLAPPRGSQQSNSIDSRTLGRHTLWVIDYDCCRPISMDTKGVEQAVTAFFKNDPFFPCPITGRTSEESLWQEFKSSFLEASQRAIKPDDQTAELPHLWIESVEKHSISRHTFRSSQ